MPVAVKKAVAALVILLAGLAGHGVLALTDYVLWDGFWYHSQLAIPGSPGMRQLFHEIGRPMDYWFVLPSAWLPGPFLPKIISLAAWVLTPLLVWRVLRRAALLPSSLAWGVALIAAVVPCFDVLGDISVMPYALAVAFFWLGWALVPGRPAIFHRAAACALFLVSFNLNSQLVFFYAVGAFLVFARLVVLDSRDPVRDAVRLAAAKPELAILPVVFWIGKIFLTPNSGAYAEYNQPVFRLYEFASGLKDFRTGFVEGTLREIVSLPAWVFLVAALAFLVGIALCRIPKVSRVLISEPAMPSPWIVPLGGVFLAVAAAFPYIVVGQGFSNEGWLSRNTILQPVPAGLCVAGLVFWLSSEAFPRKPGFWLPPLLALVALFSIASTANSLRLQALGAKQDAVSKRLADEISKNRPVVIQVRDMLPIPGTIPYYPPVIWSHLASGLGNVPAAFVCETTTLVREADAPNGPGGKTLLPLMLVNRGFLDRMIEETTVPYLFDQIPRQGTQMLVLLNPKNPVGNPAAFGARYVFAKWLDPSRRQKMVDGLVDFRIFEVTPVSE